MVGCPILFGATFCATFFPIFFPIFLAAAFRILIFRARSIHALCAAAFRSAAALCAAAIRAARVVGCPILFGATFCPILCAIFCAASCLIFFVLLLFVLPFWHIVGQYMFS